MYFKKMKLFFAVTFMLMVSLGISQNVPQGINYQAIAVDVNGISINNSPVNIRIGIYSGSAAGTLEWQETHVVTTNQFGLFAIIIGQGVTTGAGSQTNFNLINWGSASKYLKVEMDPTGGTSFVTMDNSQLLSVPYSLYSLKAGNITSPISINDLTDVDTTGTSIGKLLKWNGINWVPAKDNNSDTALFAYNSNVAHTADTALYAIHASPSDSAVYATTSGSSNYSTTSGSSTNSNHSIHSDTATYALNCIVADWQVSGNNAGATDFIGTTNAADFVIKTNNTEKMRITSAGKIGVGIAAPVASVHIVGNDGFISQGTFGTGTTMNPGAGTYMFWYPKKSAFRAGTVSATQWNDANVGNYSFATGYGTIARGIGSVAFGQTSATLVTDSFAVAMGYNCLTQGKFAVAMGNNAEAFAAYSVALGRNSYTTGIGSTSIGYHNQALAPYAAAFGYYTVADGAYSVTMGDETHSNGKTGCFIWSDNTYYSNTSLPVSQNTANNQFWVKASGGTIFYSDPTQTNFVSLAPGAGSWSTTSDKNKKEHFKSIDGEMILGKLAALPITSWNYKTQSPSIRHIGPMAQDLFAAFNFGESDTTITTSDIDGINMIALQALANRTKELKLKADEVNQLEKQVAELKEEKLKLEKRIYKIEKRLKITEDSTSSIDNK